MIRSMIKTFCNNCGENVWDMKATPIEGQAQKFNDFISAGKYPAPIEGTDTECPKCKSNYLWVGFTAVRINTEKDLLP